MTGWTVAIPSYNGARHLAEALRSIRDQRTSTFDLVVRDDHSDDPSASIAQEWADVVVNPMRLGLAGNWNACVEACRTPYLSLFHQDDRMRPGHLESHRETFLKRPDLGMVCGPTVTIDSEGRGLVDDSLKDIPSTEIYERGEFLSELSVSNPVRCSAVSLNVEAIRGIGGFDPAYRYALDWDAWIRIARDWPVAWLAEATIEVRWHAGSETQRFSGGTDDLNEQERLLLALHDSDPVRFDRRVRNQASERLARAYLNRAYQAARSGDRRLQGHALRRAVGLDLGVVGQVLREPRLAARLLLGRWR